MAQTGKGIERKSLDKEKKEERRKKEVKKKEERKKLPHTSNISEQEGTS